MGIRKLGWLANGREKRWGARSAPKKILPPAFSGRSDDIQLKLNKNKIKMGERNVKEKR